MFDRQRWCKAHLDAPNTDGVALNYNFSISLKESFLYKHIFSEFSLVLIFLYASVRDSSSDELPTAECLRSCRGTGRTCFDTFRTTRHSNLVATGQVGPTARLSINTKKVTGRAKQTIKQSMASCQSAGFYTHRHAHTQFTVHRARLGACSISVIPAIRLLLRMAFLWIQTAEQSQRPKLT